MQHETFANTEDFGAPDIAAIPERSARPGIDAPYAQYELGRAYDEMFAPDSRVRPPYAALDSRIATLPLEELNRRQQACELSFLHQGITFTVYNDNRATERIIPTDLLPRIITAPEWARLEAGLTQRILALNLFLRDIYSDGRVLKDGVVPRQMIFGSKHYRREMRGLPVPHGAYVNICGSDLIRNEAGEFVVLEDNLRVPSGVSYMLANRDVARRAFPAVFRSMNVRPIEQYPLELLATLRNLAPYGEPQLGRYGLYPTTGGRSADDAVMAMLWLLACSDGTTPVLAIAERAGLSFGLLRRAAEDLEKAGLLG